MSLMATLYNLHATAGVIISPSANETVTYLTIIVEVKNQPRERRLNTLELSDKAIMKRADSLRSKL